MLIRIKDHIINTDKILFIEIQGFTDQVLFIQYPDGYSITIDLESLAEAHKYFNEIINQQTKK